MSKEHLTVLRSFGVPLAKHWQADGKMGPYKNAARFAVEVEEVGGVRDILAVLDKHDSDQCKAIVRGEPAPGIDASDTPRNRSTFLDAPRHVLALDIDRYNTGDDSWFANPEPHLERFVREELPVDFRDVSFVWSLTGSAGHPAAGDKLKARLWFWLAEAKDSAELKAWAAAKAPKVDPSVFSPTQLIYIAPPLLDEGVSPPPMRRRGFVEGILGDEAGVESFVGVEPERRQLVRPDEMRDPREIPGIVGAFCRLVSIEEVIEVHLGGEFDRGDDDAHITWSRGGGAGGGAFISASGMHLVNNHSTAPGGAATPLNAWDAVRCYLFEDELDSESDRLEMPTSRPSHQAMVEWALEHVPGLKDELRASRPSAADEFDEFEDDDPPPPGSRKAPSKDAQEQYRLGRLEHLAQLQEGIKGCADVEALKAFCRDSIAADEDIDAADRDGVLRPAVQQRWTDLTGNRLKADLARRMVEPPRAASNAGAGGPDWLARWCYVVELDKFFGHELKLSVSPRGFDALHSQQMPVAQDGIHREKASDYAINVWGIETVSNVIYGPGKGEVFEALGRRWANSYREDSVPVSKAGDGRAARMVEAHLARLFPDERERGLLVSWLAHQVRSPGVKVRWAPYIFGAEGTGKTFLAELLGWTMGDANVRVLSGGTLKSDFTGWAAGAAVVVIEEVYQPGHIFDTEEKLKAPISNDTVDVHRKGKDSFAAPNFTNYMLLSNHADGMPVGEGNRRLFFLSVDLTKEDAEALDREGYFANLFDTCRAAGPELRAWLLGHRAHPEFDPGGRAPKTAARAEVIELSRSDAESVLRDAVGEAKAFTAEWARAVLKSAGLEAPTTRGWTRLVTSLGFHPVARRVRVGGKRVRIYPHLSQRGTADEVLKELIVRSVPTDFDDFSDD